MPVRGDDFEATYEVINKLDVWVSRLASPLIPARRVPHGRSFKWEFREQTAYVLLVAKAVRMASGLNAAMQLAETGFVVESASLLRMVVDFTTEANAVVESLTLSEPTTAQKELVAQFFEGRQQGPGASVTGARRYVGRQDLMKTHVRLSNAAGVDGEQTRRLLRELMELYDGYVHGGYSTAMELYRGDRHEFMLHGHEDPNRKVLQKVAISGVLVSVVQLFKLIAWARGDKPLQADIGQSLASLEESGEQNTHTNGQ